MSTFTITHPEHGEAHANEDQLAEFKRLGWSRADEKQTAPASREKRVEVPNDGPADNTPPAVATAPAAPSAVAPAPAPVVPQPAKPAAKPKGSKAKAK